MAKKRMTHAELIASIQGGSSSRAAPAQPSVPTTGKSTGGTRKAMTHAEMLASIAASQRKPVAGPAEEYHDPSAPVIKHPQVQQRVSSQADHIGVVHQMTAAKHASEARKTVTARASFATDNLSPTRYDRSSNPDMLTMKEAGKLMTDAKTSMQMGTVENASGIAIPTFGTEAEHVYTPMKAQRLVSDESALQKQFYGGEVFYDGIADASALDPRQKSDTVFEENDISIEKKKSSLVAYGNRKLKKAIEDVEEEWGGGPEKIHRDFGDYFSDFDKARRERIAFEGRAEKKQAVGVGFVTVNVRKKLAQEQEEREKKERERVEQEKEIAASKKKTWKVRTLSRNMTASDHIPADPIKTRVRAVERTDIGTVKHGYK